jgi:hypothetical protein
MRLEDGEELGSGPPRPELTVSAPVRRVTLVQLLFRHYCPEHDISGHACPGGLLWDPLTESHGARPEDLLFVGEELCD